MKNKKTPNLKSLSPEELKEWEEKLNTLRASNHNTDLTRKIGAARGWIF